MKTIVKIKIQILCLMLISNWSLAQGTPKVTNEQWDMRNSIDESGKLDLETTSSTRSNSVILSLSPATTTVNCGSTTPITFAVLNISNYPGHIYYRWNVGTGWATTDGVPVSGLLITTSNILTLVPLSYPPSNISVLPVLNGVPYNNPLYSLVSFSPFYSNAGLSGSGAICSGSSTYTMNGLQNNETVSWAISDPTKASISNTTGNQVTLTKLSDGDVNLIGTIRNACNQTNVKTMKVGLGAPMITKPNCSGGFGIITPIDQLPVDNSQCDLCRSSYYYTDENMIEAEATGGNNLTWEWEQLTNNYGWTTQQHRARFLPYRMGQIRFRVRAGNVCGWSAWRNQNITISEDCPDDQNFDQNPSRMAKGANNLSRASANFFNAYPNPASSIINLELANREHLPNAKATISAELFDFYGFSRTKIEMDQYTAQIDVRDLPRGTYVLKISIDGKVESHQIVVE